MMYFFVLVLDKEYPLHILQDEYGHFVVLNYHRLKVTEGSSSFCPGVLKCNDSIENSFFLCSVFINSEVALPFKLKS